MGASWHSTIHSLLCCPKRHNIASTQQYHITEVSIFAAACLTKMVIISEIFLCVSAVLSYQNGINLRLCCVQLGKSGYVIQLNLNSYVTETGISRVDKLLNSISWLLMPWLRINRLLTFSKKDSDMHPLGIEKWKKTNIYTRKHPR